MKHKEIEFEKAIEHCLLQPESGYELGNPAAYNAEKGLFPQDIITFIRKSQPKRWAMLEQFYGQQAGEALISDLEKELAAKGVLHVLRHGFKCFGKTFRLAYFTPNTRLNPKAWEDYGKNRLTVTRQLHQSPKFPMQSVDVVLALNGLPVVTLELKNPLTGQTVAHAKKQYRERDARDPLFRFKERALVHFAVDPDEVYMTTRLEGNSTFFLPFNRGFKNGAGNPPSNYDNYRTAYLWEQVLQKDSLLDIIARFLHLEVTEKEIAVPEGIKTIKKEILIFPRYHQLDVVRSLVDSSREKGAGYNYLIQHSAGSGKSNSIAWLAHRLSSLHNEQDEKVFNTVIVITDRRVLDQQLQNTIYQFEHKEGVVQKIEENTQQLAKALSDNTPIIITTIQKFPFIAQALETLAKKGEGVKIETAGKRFAVIVDEAHSSQSGETATELRKVLNKEGIQAAIASQMLEEEDEDLSEEARENMYQEMLKRPKQPNISFFAFTATPKYRTKLNFNEPGPDGKSPFHLYSMRQAIEEGFIMDVLANYTTYKAYYGLIKKTEDDPEVPKKKAAKALARFMSLHPHNIRQKVEVIVEHFRLHTRHKIGGSAKAMVVTGSRLHAVRYKRAFDEYIKEKAYTGIRSLVAFSGTVQDPDIPNSAYTEVGMNAGVKESELPEKFATDAYQVLLVAEKYQTGFDQPLLHTMYVDKRLAGIQAVQTLSRLNRTARGKEDTFVLDFVNTHEDIYEAFKPYYEATAIDAEPDPHQLSKLQHTLDQWQVYTYAEIVAFCEVWFSNKKDPSVSDHKKMNSILDKAVERFKEQSEAEQEEIKSQMASFQRLYGFISQIVPYQDSALEKLYTYLRFLLTKLPHRNQEQFQLVGEVALKYYRLQQISAGSIELGTGEADPLKGPTEVGTGAPKDDKVNLSMLVDKLNDLFGTEFTKADELFFDQVAESAAAKDDIIATVRANTFENFMHYFMTALDGLIFERLDGNEELVKKTMNNPDMYRTAAQHLGRDVYNRVSRRE
ncbi:type I restriction endonuclease subunit R [Cesiribacter andamanensis]|nr:type I restriction endonuclease [Cesiribacter andamanensis]